MAAARYVGRVGGERCMARARERGVPHRVPRYVPGVSVCTHRADEVEVALTRAHGAMQSADHQHGLQRREPTRARGVAQVACNLVVDDGYADGDISAGSDIRHAVGGAIERVSDRAEIEVRVPHRSQLLARPAHARAGGVLPCVSRIDRGFGPLRRSLSDWFGAWSPLGGAGHRDLVLLIRNLCELEIDQVGVRSHRQQDELKEPRVPIRVERVGLLRARVRARRHLRRQHINVPHLRRVLARFQVEQLIAFALERHASQRHEECRVPPHECGHSERCPGREDEPAFGDERVARSLLNIRHGQQLRRGRRRVCGAVATRSIRLWQYAGLELDELDGQSGVCVATANAATAHRGQALCAYPPRAAQRLTCLARWTERARETG
eukprot:6423062-Prymnesium_polylepis.1